MACRRAHRHVGHPARQHRWLGIAAALLTLGAAAHAAGSATALQQAQPAFGAAAESVAPKPLALPPPAPTGLARSATTVDLKAPPRAAQPAASNSLGKGALDAKASKMGKTLFDMDDRAIIIVSGRQTTAGAAKKSVLSELAKKDGPPRIVPGGSRKLDVAVLNLAHAGAAVLPTLSTRTQSQGVGPGVIGGDIYSPPPTNGTPAKSGGNFAQKNPHVGAVVNDLLCTDKGPPAISEIRGKLRAGGDTFTAVGRCFGNRSARLVVSGKFGTLDTVVTAWDMNTITAKLPAGIQGVPDHRVDLWVVSTEFSKPFSAAFFAQRTRIDVPTRLWIGEYPIYSTTMYANDEFFNRDNTEKARAAHLLVRVNEACALDTVDFKVSAGRISAFSGWEQGPPYQGSLTVNWLPSCTAFESVEVDITRSHTYSRSRLCKVLIEPRATAYCPLGVSPDPVSLKAQGAPARLR